MLLGRQTLREKLAICHGVNFFHIIGFSGEANGGRGTERWKD